MLLASYNARIFLISHCSRMYRRIQTKQNARSKLHVKRRRHRLYSSNTLIRRFSLKNYFVLGYDQRSAGVLATAGRRQWNTTRRQSKRNKAGEESESSVTQCGMIRQDSRAATASALQVRVRRPLVKLNVDHV